MKTSEVFLAVEIHEISIMVYGKLYLRWCFLGLFASGRTKWLSPQKDGLHIFLYMYIKEEDIPKMVANSGSVCVFSFFGSWSVLLENEKSSLRPFFSSLWNLDARWMKMTTGMLFKRFGDMYLQSVNKSKRNVNMLGNILGDAQIL